MISKEFLFSEAKGNCLLQKNAIKRKLGTGPEAQK